MIAAIIIVCAALFALFLVAAVAGNRAQTRMAMERAELERRQARSARATIGEPQP